MSKVDVIMPQMGESIAEGTLTRWLKSVGDAVERDEDLFEISTDKVDADIPSPAAGVLAEVLVQNGETVEVNTIVARIETDMTAGVGQAETQTGDMPDTPAPTAPAPDPAPADTAAATLPEAVATTAADGSPASREERLRTTSTR